MRRRAKSLVAGLLSLAAIYLIPVNLALNLPATRDTLNAFQPEQWRLNWSSAWSVLPMRVQLRGFAADGQTPKAQWQLDAKAVGASLSLAALLRGEVRISDLDLTDVEIRLRALAEPDAPSASADTAAADSLPSIRNRSPEATARPRPVARKRSSGMKLAVADLRLAGQHAFWINRFRGEVDGTLGGSFALDAATGEVELTDGRVDLLLRSLTIAGIPDPTGDARLEGQIAIPAMSLASLSSPDSLRRIEIDGEVDIPVHNLAFVELFAGDLGALELTGKGRLTGRVVNLDGALQPGTAFSVDASELALAWPPYRFSGDGEVRLGLGTDQNEVGQVALDVRFGRVDGQLVRAADDGDDDAEAIALPLFTGQGLDAKLRFPPVSEADGSGPIRVPRVLLRIPEVEVPDLTLYNALLPPQWGLKLGGGDGRLSMQAELDEQALQLALDLSSTDAAIALADYRGRGDLSLEVKARAERGSAATLDLAGSSLRLGGVRIDRAEGEASADQANDADGAGAWDAAFVIDTARLAIPLTESSDDRDPLASLAKELAAGSFSSVLALADGQIAATLTVSRLDWISALLGRPLGLRVDGSGVVATDIVLEQGWPAAGTQLQVSPEGLRVAILEHVVDGQGNAVLDLQEGGRGPRARLGISIANGRLRRDDAQQASVDQVGLGLTVTGPLAAENAAQAATVELDIKSARVQDVSAFNAYLPPNAPLAIDSGEAALAGRLTLTADSAAGELVLEATEIGLTADDNALTADVLLNLNVRGGTPAEMRFDVGGSALRMQNVRVQGSTMSHDQPGWSARLQLNETELVWEKPMRLDLAAGITLQDTRPIVAILGNIRGKHDWIGKLLTADGLTGHLDLLLDDQGATIRDSRVLTDQVGIRFKGRSDPSGREAMLFVRYGQLAGALSQEGEQRRFSIIKARAKFDAYTPGETPLDTAGGDEVSEAEAAARSAADQESGAAASGGDAADSTDLMQREKGRSTKNEPTGSAFLDNEN